jgi:hypothetical protein
MLVSKWIYSYDENNILPGNHQVKIMGYSLSRLEVKLYSYWWKKYLFIFVKLKKSTTCVKSSIAIMSMDAKLFIPWKRKVDP